MLKKLFLLIFLLTGLFSGCAASATTDAGPLTASGYIEAEEIAIAPQVGGRVMAILAEAGAEVAAGTPLVRLDDRIAQAQVALAEAKVREAEAQLALARNGVAPADLRVLEAQQRQAQAGRAGACQAWESARAILENPQELDRQIAVLRAQVRAAEAGTRAAEAGKDAAELGLALFEDAREQIANAPEKVVLYDGSISDLPYDIPQEILDFLAQNPTNGTYRFGDTEIVLDGGHVTIYYYPNVALPMEAHFVPNEYWKAWIALNSAQAQQQGAQNALALLYAIRDNPQQIQAQVDVAASQCRQAEALTAAAAAGVEAARAGATSDELAALEALLLLAQAELEQAQVALARQTLVAPASGIVLDQLVEVGELAIPGGAALTLADLDTVRLTLYVPNARLGEVQLGQPVQVRVDSFPDRVFTGELVYLSPEAEFPPANVPQADSRAALVFAVRVRIPNPDHALRSGMPAEAVFLVEDF